MKLAMPSNAKLTIGAKQTSKAIKRGEVKMVYLANDSDDRIALPLLELCDEFQITVDKSFTMTELGVAAHIKVGAAAVGVL